VLVGQGDGAALTHEGVTTGSGEPARS
jgi:hypothetical protein